MSYLENKYVKQLGISRDTIRNWISKRNFSKTIKLPLEEILYSILKKLKIGFIRMEMKMQNKSPKQIAIDIVRN